MQDGTWGVVKHIITTLDSDAAVMIGLKTNVFYGNQSENIKYLDSQIHPGYFIKLYI